MAAARAAHGFLSATGRRWAWGSRPLPAPWSWPPGINLVALVLGASYVTMTSNGGHQEDEDKGWAAHHAATAEDDEGGLLEDGPDDATDFQHTGEGEDNGSGDGDCDGDAPLRTALLPGNAREATGRAGAALLSLGFFPLARWQLGTIN